MKQAVKWTAEGAVKGESRVFCDVGAYVSCRGYNQYPARARVTVNQGGTANEHSSLTDPSGSAGVFFIPEETEGPDP